MSNSTVAPGPIRYSAGDPLSGFSLGQAGIGLVEIMVAMAIGLFMLGGVLTLVLWISQARVELDKTSEQIENGRYAIQLMSDELQLAGFYGQSLIGGATPSLPTPCPAGEGDLGFSYDSSTVTTTLPVAVQGIASLPMADTSCFSNYTTGSEAIVLHRVETESVASAADGALYVQMSACEDDAQPVTFGLAGVDDFPLLQKDCSSSAVLWPYTFRAFYLGSCDICSSGDGIPTLKMAELRVSGSGIQTVAQSVVEGIEDLHFQYGMDLDTDGAPDCYVSDPSADDPPASAGCPTGGWSDSAASNWSNVVSVRISLLARSIEPSYDWTDVRTYDLGRESRVGPFNDHYKRQVYSTVVTLPNVSGVRE